MYDITPLGTYLVLYIYRCFFRGTNQFTATCSQQAYQAARGKICLYILMPYALKCILIKQQYYLAIPPPMRNFAASDQVKSTASAAAGLPLAAETNSGYLKPCPTDWRRRSLGDTAQPRGSCWSCRRVAVWYIGSALKNPRKSQESKNQCWKKKEKYT